MLNIINKIRLNKIKNVKLDLPKGFSFTAHTGCVNTKPNSLDAMKKGVQSGANIIEFDLRADGNGELVLSHDEPKGGEILLSEAFALLSSFDNIRANVDIKMVDALEKVYPLAKEYNVEDRIFYTGVKDEFVAPVKEKSPEISYFLNVKVSKLKNKNKNYLLSLVEKVKKAGAIGINFKYKSASKELVEVFHENGLLVSIWTVDNEYNMYKILSFGPDNITTRRPDKLSEIISQKN